jgi:hypothetical protein
LFFDSRHQPGTEFLAVHRQNRILAARVTLRWDPLPGLNVAP